MAMDQDRDMDTCNSCGHVCSGLQSRRAWHANAQDEVSCRIRRGVVAITHCRNMPFSDSRTRAALLATSSADGFRTRRCPWVGCVLPPSCLEAFFYFLFSIIIVCFCSVLSLIPYYITSCFAGDRLDERWMDG